MRVPKATISKDSSSQFIQNHGSPWLGKRLVTRANKKFKNGLYEFSFKLLSRPKHLAVMRTIFAITRKIHPICNVFGVCILTKHEDVKEVLARMEDFSSADSMNKKTPAGPFVLSIDWRIHHDRELKILQNASFPFIDADAERITKLARDKAQEKIILARKSPQEHFNIAVDLTEDVALEIVEEYIGVKPRKDRDDELRHWLRILAAQIFTPPPLGSPRQAQTAAAASNLIAYIHRIIGEFSTREKNGSPIKSDTLLLRLVKLTQNPPKGNKWLNDEWVCALVAGMIVAGNATVTRAQTQAIYRLLTIPRAKELAVKTAQVYSINYDDVKSKRNMLQIMYEALRFNPMLPVLSPRYCIRDTIIGAKYDRATHVKAGTNVLPLVYAAMFDETVFKKPNEFRTDRKLENYLHFGWGPHICFGKFVADVQFIEVAAALFGNSDFSVEALPKTEIEYDGPAAINYPVLLKSQNAKAEGS